MFVLLKANSRGVEGLFLQRLHFYPTSRETPEPPGDKNSDFLFLFVCCGHKLLRASLKARTCAHGIRWGRSSKGGEVGGRIHPSRTGIAHQEFLNSNVLNSSLILKRIIDCEAREVGWFPSGVSGLQCFRWAHCASTRRILGARCFQNGHFGRISSTLYFTVFQSLGGHASARRVSHEPCFCQAHCFVQGRLRFLPVTPNPTCARSHIWGFRRIAASPNPVLANKCVCRKTQSRHPPPPPKWSQKQFAENIFVIAWTPLHRFNLWNRRLCPPKFLC